MDNQRYLTVSKLQPTDTFPDSEALDEYYKYLIQDRHNLLAFFVLTVLLAQYFAGDKIEKNAMGWACGAYG